VKALHYRESKSEVQSKNWKRERLYICTREREREREREKDESQIWDNS